MKKYSINCSTVEEFLTSFIDQELEDETSIQMRSHFEECEKCSTELQVQIGIKRLLIEKLKRESIPSSLKNSILTDLPAQKVLEPTWLIRKVSLSFRPVSGIVAAAMLIIAVISAQYTITPTNEQFNVPVFDQMVDTVNPLSIDEGVNATIVGRIVCVGCYLRDNYMAGHSDDYGKKMGVVTSDGELWSFTGTRQSDQIVKADKIIGKTVHIQGRVFQKAHFIDVNDFQLME